MNITSALYEKLSSDLTLRGLLASYGGEPAIFTTWPTPTSAARPYLLIVDIVSDLPFDALVAVGRDFRVDILCVVDHTGSLVALNTLTERVRALLHRAELSLDAGRSIRCTVENIVTAPSDDSVDARVVTVRILTRM